MFVENYSFCGEALVKGDAWKLHYHNLIAFVGISFVLKRLSVGRFSFKSFSNRRYELRLFSLSVSTGNAMQKVANDVDATRSAP